VLQAIEDTEKRLEERHAERDGLVARGKEQLQNIESQITLQQEVITLSLSLSLNLSLSLSLSPTCICRSTRGRTSKNRLRCSRR
jgi:hypothetical protein